MTLREQILFEVHGDVSKINEAEEKKEGLESFISAFIVDAKEYGLEEATKMYDTLYGIGEELTLLKEDLEPIVDMLNEDGMPEFGSVEPATLSTKLRVGAAPLSAGGITMKKFIEGQPNLLAKIRNFIGMTDKKKEALADHLVGQKAMNLAKTGGVDAISGAAPAAPNVLASLWGKIKTFFKGAFEPLRQMFATGNFSGILANPLIKGALAAGGVVAVIAILKKIFGNKRFNVEKQKETMRKIQAQLDANKKQ